MGKQYVPEKYVHTCDACGVDKESKSDRRPSTWVAIDVRRDACDFQGQAVADGSFDILLCPTCGPSAVGALNDWHEKWKVRKGAP